MLRLRRWLTERPHNAMRVLLCGGGTGGHIYPTLSLARALLRGEEGVCKPAPPVATPSGSMSGPAGGNGRDGGLHAILLVGSKGNVDEQLLTRDDVPYTTIDSRPLVGLRGLETAKSLAVNAAAVMQALPIVMHFRPDAVVGSGGYACAPVVVAGAMLRSGGVLPHLRIMLIEPNIIPGAANRRLARYATEVWGGYEDSPTARHFEGKFVLTGIPVRADLYTPLSKTEARRSLGLDPQRFTVLVFGGSQGARSLNVATSGMVARRRLPPNWQVLHLTGRRDYEWMAAERKTDANDNRYALEPYLDGMGLAYWAADIAVCRSGASTLAEVATTGLPPLFVPYPKASEGHQRANAEYFVARGAAFCLDDAALNPDSLYWMLVEMAEPATLARLSEKLRFIAHPQAVQAMISRLLDGDILASPR